MLLNSNKLQNTYPETLLEDVNWWFERLLKMAKGVNSWLQDLDTARKWQNAMVKMRFYSVLLNAFGFK